MLSSIIQSAINHFPLSPSFSSLFPSPFHHHFLPFFPVGKSISPKISPFFLLATTQALSIYTISYSILRINKVLLKN
jgi:hypothetical protein